jgi:hypothetical protein
MCVIPLDARILHAANRQDQFARTIHLHEGQKVVRGPDWKWGRQDGSNEDGAGRLLGEAARGVVVEVKGTGWCKVRWATGIQETYRAGAEDGTRVRCRALPRVAFAPVCSCVGFVTVFADVRCPCVCLLLAAAFCRPCLVNVTPVCELTAPGKYDVVPHDLGTPLPVLPPAVAAIEDGLESTLGLLSIQLGVCVSCHSGRASLKKRTH